LFHRTPPFRFPSLLVTIQAPVIGVLATIGLRTCWHKECHRSEYWPAHLTLHSFARVAGVGLLFGGDIVATQLALLHAPVALVEVMKCLIPAIVLAQMAFLLRARPPASAVVAVTITCSGVLMATGSGGVAYNMEAGGFTMAVCAAGIAATRVVAMQFLLQGERRCPMPLMLLYVSPALFFTGMSSFLAIELRTLTRLPEALENENLVSTVALIVISCAMAFCLNLCELWCVRDTSALVLTLIGAIKTVLLVVFTAVRAGRVLSPMAVLGSLLAIGGVAVMKICKRAPESQRDVSRVELHEDMNSAVDEGDESRRGATSSELLRVRCGSEAGEPTVATTSAEG